MNDNLLNKIKPLEPFRTFIMTIGTIPNMMLE